MPILRKRKNDEEYRNPYGETYKEFMEKYKPIYKLAQACWYHGIHPEELKKDLIWLIWGQKDAVAMLEEQEKEIAPGIDATGIGCYLRCGACTEKLPDNAKYCPNCGRKVKWE